jgi:hypothetical protein
MNEDNANFLTPNVKSKPPATVQLVSEVHVFYFILIDIYVYNKQTQASQVYATSSNSEASSATFREFSVD